METDIENDDIIFRFDQNHISSHFFHAAEGYYPDHSLWNRRNFILNFMFIVLVFAVERNLASAVSLFRILVGRTARRTFLIMSFVFDSGWLLFPARLNSRSGRQSILFVSFDTYGAKGESCFFYHFLLLISKYIPNILGLDVPRVYGTETISRHRDRVYRQTLYIFRGNIYKIRAV